MMNNNNKQRSRKRSVNHMFLQNSYHPNLHHSTCSCVAVPVLCVCVYYNPMDSITEGAKARQEALAMELKFHKDKLKLNTLPTTMEVELTTNPFLLAENSEEFKRIRLKKDVF